MLEHFRLILAVSPSLLLVAAVFMAAFPRDGHAIPRRLLDAMLVLPVGVQAVLQGLFQVFAPDMSAALVGWRISPFQFQVGMADIAIGLVAIDAFQRSLGYKSAVVAYVVLYYSSTALGHVPQVFQAGARPLGYFELGLAITVAKAISLPILLWWCWNLDPPARRAGDKGRIGSGGRI